MESDPQTEETREFLKLCQRAKDLPWPAKSPSGDLGRRGYEVATNYRWLAENEAAIAQDPAFHKFLFVWWKDAGFPVLGSLNEQGLIALAASNPPAAATIATNQQAPAAATPQGGNPASEGKPQQKAPKPKACYNCQSTNHLLANCPLKGSKGDTKHRGKRGGGGQNSLAQMVGEAVGTALVATGATNQVINRFRKRWK